MTNEAAAEAPKDSSTQCVSLLLVSRINSSAPNDSRLLFTSEVGLQRWRVSASPRAGSAHPSYCPRQAHGTNYRKGGIYYSLLPLGSTWESRRVAALSTGRFEEVTSSYLEKKKKEKKKKMWRWSHMEGVVRNGAGEAECGPHCLFNTPSHTLEQGRFSR